MRKNGFAQIPLMIGLLIMAIAVPVATKLVQQNQNTENRAAGCSGSCYSGMTCAMLGLQNGSGTCTNGGACCAASSCLSNGTATASYGNCCSKSAYIDGSGVLVCGTAPTTVPVVNTSGSCDSLGGICGSFPCSTLKRDSLNGECNLGLVCCKSGPTNTPVSTTRITTDCLSSQSGDKRCVDTSGEREVCWIQTTNPTTYKWVSTTSCGNNMRCVDGECISSTEVQQNTPAPTDQECNLVTNNLNSFPLCSSCSNGHYYSTVYGGYRCYSGNTEVVSNVNLVKYCNGLSDTTSCSTGGVCVNSSKGFVCRYGSIVPALTGTATPYPTDCPCVNGKRTGSGCTSFEYGQACGVTATPFPTGCPCVNGKRTGSGCTSFEYGQACGTATPTPTGFSGGINNGACTGVTVKGEKTSDGTWVYFENAESAKCICGSTYYVSSGKYFCGNNPGTSSGGTCTQCAGLASAKGQGDADCSGATNINDASIWRSEFISGELGTVSKNSWRADFDCDGKVTLNDISIWRANFIKGL